MAKPIDPSKTYGMLYKAIDALIQPSNPKEETTLYIPCANAEVRKKRVATLISAMSRWNAQNADKLQKAVAIKKMPRPYTIQASLTENQLRLVRAYFRNNLGLEVEFIKEAGTDYAISAQVTFGRPPEVEQKTAKPMAIHRKKKVRP